jgi:hypothetical protein
LSKKNPDGKALFDQKSILLQDTLKQTQGTTFLELIKDGVQSNFYAQNAGSLICLALS